MKRLFRTICPVLCCLLFSCSRDAPKQITLTVTLLHIPSSVHTAYLDEIRPAGAYTIDTAAINPLKGAFTFDFYSTGSEGLYCIRLDDSTRLLLALNNEDVTIRGDYTRPGSLQVQGSPASLELQHFLSGLNAQNKHLRRLSEAYASLQKAQAQDSMLRKHAAAIRDRRQAILDTILYEARTTSSPVNAVFALSILDDSGAWEAGKPVFDGLLQRFPGNNLVRRAVDAYHKKMNGLGRGMSIGVGDQAPELSYPDTAGNVISLRDLRGKYVLVDFWASWCAPCRAENPNVVKAWKLFKDKNFTILGVSLDTKRSSWEKAIIQDKLGWRQVSDLKGWNSAPAAIYGVEAIPANFLLDPRGKVIATNLKGDSLISKLRTVLAP